MVGRGEKILGHSEFPGGRLSGTLRTLFLPPFRLRDQKEEHAPGVFILNAIC